MGPHGSSNRQTDECPTDVSRSVRSKYMCREGVSTRVMPYMQSQVQVSRGHSQIYVRIVLPPAECCVAVAISIFMDECSWHQKARRRWSRRRWLVFLPPCHLPQEKQCLAVNAVTSGGVACSFRPCWCYGGGIRSTPSVKSIDAVLGKVLLPCF